MSVLEFDKNQLGNLEYALRREMLSTNRAGGYMSTTIVCCNTRKYHGLFVGPVREGDEHDYVMLSSLDETVVQHDHSFNLALHRFPETYEPKGHKYLVDFTYTPLPALTYRVGGVLLRKEILWIHAHAQLLIRYTLLEARSQTILRLRPFLAFRDKHTLSKANFYADGRSFPVTGGVRNRLYEGFPWLYLQTDAGAEFIPAPDWYYNFEYTEERERGYDYLEDLLTTGYFETEITKGKPVVFSCSLKEVSSPAMLDEMFEAEAARRSRKDDFLSCLRHSARQFIVRNAGGT
nr:glycogen debranching enzyme N-terminal domain-containing protein [Tidjanibacter sp.]